MSEEELAVVLQGVCYQRLIGGGGIVDFANKDYQEHQPTSWNKQIDQLLKDGHITSLQAETEKLATAKQKISLPCLTISFPAVFIWWRQSPFR